MLITAARARGFALHSYVMTAARTAHLSIICALVLGAFCMPSAVRAATESVPKSPNAAGDSVSNGGASAWESSTSTATLGDAVRSDGGAYATAELTTTANQLGSVSKYLWLSDFRFALPTDAIIQGISVSVLRRAGTAHFIHDTEVRLIAGTTATAVNEADPSTFWGDEFAAVSYGGVHDTWGRAWTPAVLNDDTFGVLISAQNTDAASAHSARIDTVVVTVTYTEPPPVPTSGTYDIPLTTGWNLVSTPGVLADASPMTVFASTTADAVWSYDPANPAADSGWLVYDPSHPEFSNLNAIEPGDGYFVHASTTSTLSLSASLFAPGATPPARALQSGWNLIGSYVPIDEDIDDALATIGWAGLEYTALWKWNTATQSFLLPPAIRPGEGYWILLDAPHLYAPADL